MLESPSICTKGALSDGRENLQVVSEALNKLSRIR
jgi:hypothetical protein